MMDNSYFREPSFDDWLDRQRELYETDWDELQEQEDAREQKGHDMYDEQRDMDLEF